jgi:hypothetical protein
MPRFDPYWRLGACLGLIFALAGSILSAWYVAPAIAATFSIPTSAAPYKSLIFDGVCCLVAGLALVPLSLRARERQRLRRIAMTTDPSAVPLSLPILEVWEAWDSKAASMPDVKERSLFVPWRSSSRLAWPTSSLILIIFCALLTGVGLIGWTYSFQRYGPLSMEEQVEFGLTAIWIGGVAVGAFIFLLARLFSRPGPAYGIEANDEGITVIRAGGIGWHLRWEDARLLEVALTSYGGGFVLHGLNSRIEWGLPDFLHSPSSLRGIGMEEDDLRRRHVALLSLIRARTGLEVRTFSRFFRSPDSSLRSSHA